MRVASLWWGAVRFGFRLLYNEMAFTYDLVSRVVSLGEWRCWQRTALQYLPEPSAGTILELAHGTGNLQLDLHAAGYQTIGYDLSSAMGRIASDKLLHAGITPRLVRGEAQNLPFPANHITAIVCTFPTNFIVSEDSLREIYRVLQPGGCAVVVLSGMLAGKSPLHRTIEWLYAITGQRDDAEIGAEEVFGGRGLQVQAVEEHCPNSRVQLVCLKKPR
jgi:ubiquinone/menaquinone biosynthesis C-methylase UbiE